MNKIKQNNNLKTEKIKDNPAGSSFYEEAIGKLKTGDRIQFIHEPLKIKNKEYTNAIKIIAVDSGEQIGFVKEGEEHDSIQKKILRTLKDNELFGEIFEVAKLTGYASKYTYTYITEIVTENVKIENFVPDDNTHDWEKITSFTNEELWYSDILHKYYSTYGELMRGGSTFAQQFAKPFPTHIADSMASKLGTDEKTIKAMWSSNAKISTTHGSALHYAMEHYFLYKDFKDAKKNSGQFYDYHLPNPPELRKAVLSFPDLSLNIIPEAFVSNIERKMVGQIDALIKNKDGSYTVGDYKTAKESTLNDEKLNIYFMQLRYYGTALALAGFKVKDLKLYLYHNRKWTVYKRHFNKLEDKYFNK